MPSIAAKINGVLLNDWFQFQKWLEIEISSKNIRFEYHEWFWIKMFLMLILIFGCDNKLSTISVWPLDTAKINGESLNDWFQFQKWFEIEILSKN